MARILIAGAEGALGRAWTLRLRSAGLSLSPALPGPVEVVPCSRRELDVSTPRSAAEVIVRERPDVVLNCAAVSDLERCDAFPGEALLVNRDGADHVARACKTVGALPVYFSTDLVFDGGKLGPYLEEDPPNPLNTYGESKLAGELRTARDATRHLIVRTGWLYGQPGTHFLSPDYEEPLIDTQIGQATWVEDFLGGVIFLLKEGKTGRWHVSSPGAVTQMQVASRAWEILEQEPRETLKWDPAVSPKLPGSTVLDTSKLAEAGHRLRSWEVGLEKYLETLRESD
jgi:dTDP-4-dehydrorhamnose reductase